MYGISLGARRDLLRPSKSPSWQVRPCCQQPRYDVNICSFRVRDRLITVYLVARSHQNAQGAKHRDNGSHDDTELHRDVSVGKCPLDLWAALLRGAGSLDVEPSGQIPVAVSVSFDSVKVRKNGLATQLTVLEHVKLVGVHEMWLC